MLTCCTPLTFIFVSHTQGLSQQAGIEFVFGTVGAYFDSQPIRRLVKVEQSYVYLLPGITPEIVEQAIESI